MDTIFMNSENCKTSGPYRLSINLADKSNLKESHKYLSLSNFSIYCTWKNIEKSYKNRFRESTPTWNGWLELPHGSYSVSQMIQD